ncbi:MAG: hypothetical protein VX498_03295 [Myxococcota bacterium]|nr:hypothetical protein [Myxococcota bacterium]
MEPKIQRGDGSMEAQLVALYRNQQELQAALGTSDARVVVALFEGLCAQLEALYAERDKSQGGLPRAR